MFLSHIHPWGAPGDTGSQGGLQPRCCGYLCELQAAGAGGAAPGTRSEGAALITCSVTENKDDEEPLGRSVDSLFWTRRRCPLIFFSQKRACELQQVRRVGFSGQVLHWMLLSSGISGLQQLCPVF